MQISPIRNQNFCAKLRNTQKVVEASIRNGLPEEEAREMLSELKSLPDDLTITFNEPQTSYSTLGRVFVENSKDVCYDVTVSPVLYNKNTLSRYVEAAKYLATEFNYDRKPGVYDAD